MVDSWLDRVSVWIEQREPTSVRDETLLQLDEAWKSASWETDAFLGLSSSLERAFSEIVEKVDNAAR